MKTKQNIARLVLIGALLLPLKANAALLFQSIPDLTAAPVDNWYSSNSGFWQAFDTFSIASDSDISEIDFAQDVMTRGPVQVQIYTLSNAVPGAQIFSQTFNVDSFAFIATAFDANIPLQTGIGILTPVGLSLAAGSYDISFYNPNVLLIPSYSNSTGAFYDSGFHDGQSLGFSLSGTVEQVPEPPALMIIGAGLFSLGMIRHRRSRLNHRSNPMTTFGPR